MENNSSDSIEGIIKDESVNVLETVTEKLCDEKQKESENNNVITSSINVEISDEGNNQEVRKELYSELLVEVWELLCVCY